VPDRRSGTDDGPNARVARDAGGDVVERLAGLSGSDLTTLLLEVMRRRAETATPAEVLHRSASDRFTVPASVPFDRMRVTETAILSALPEGTETIALSPVVPLGTHRSVSMVDPRWTVATIRGTEVAADPTNGLALVAAGRRRELVREGRADEVVRLAASQRVVRAQRFEDDGAAFAHFQIVGHVTAGRDPGGRAFERGTLAEHVRWLAQAFAAAGATDVRLGLTDLSEGVWRGVVDEGRRAAADAGVEVVDEPDRERGRRYYLGCCFQMYARLGDDVISIADGGFVDWSAQLTASRKERLCISGIGLERLTLASASTRGTGR
jgi:hypothetical protein